MDINIKPSFGRVLIKIVKQKKDESGIIIPSSEDKKVAKGEIMAVGNMEKDHTFSVGEIAYFTKYSGDVVHEHINENYIMIKAEEILGVENGK